MTRRAFGLATAGLCLFPWEPREGCALAEETKERAATGADELYRPQAHYSPPNGFMNDPNGLVVYQGEYHLFYQYNPFEAKAGHVHWGHAVSPDGLRWRTLPIALQETKTGQAFSGSAVVDATNTSGLFPQTPGGLIAIYTRAGTDRQAQELAVSQDAGRTFTAYSGNPVLDVNSGSFRDPKVFRHEASGTSGQWIMAAVRSREHRVVFYGSPDLKRWTELSDFGHAGILGVDYECPDLARLPVEGGGFKWVLFVSINPGAPQGGSAVQYFVGDFDGIRFTPSDYAARFADFGKDFYALQSFNGLAEDAPPTGIAWISNWQYCNETPTGNWRGVMSLPRQLRLRRKGDDWRLVQSPPSLDALADRTLPMDAKPKKQGELRATMLPAGAAVEARLRFRVPPSSVTTVRLANQGGERLEIGYDATATQLFVDRGGCRGFSHRFFTDKFAVALDPGTQKIDLHLVIDRCTLEVFAQDGEAVASVLHFPQKPLNRLSVSSTGAVEFQETSVRTLRATMPS